MYHINHNIHTTFYHSSGLTRNWMFNRSIYYVLFTDTAFLLGTAELRLVVIGMSVLHIKMSFCMLGTI